MSLNVITNGTNTGWIPEVWAQEIMRHLRNYIALAPRVNRDYDNEVANYGDTINVPLPLTLEAADAPTSGTADVVADGVAVKLDKFKTVDVQIGDLFKAQSRPDVMQNVTRAAGIALAEAVESDLLALYASAASAVGTAGTDVTAAVLREARQKLVEAKAPQLEDKFVVLSPKDYAAILGDANITNALNYGGADAVREGRVPSVYGLQILESQLVPVVDDGNGNLTTYNLAFTRDFAVLATRPLQPPMDGTPSAVISDPDTQLSFRLTLQYSNTAKAHVMSVDLLYGVQAIRTGLGVQVLG